MAKMKRVDIIIKRSRTDDRACQTVVDQNPNFSHCEAPIHCRYGSASQSNIIKRHVTLNDPCP